LKVRNILRNAVHILTIMLFSSGPLFVGEIVTDHIGVCFTYGLLVDGHLIKDNMIYVHAMWMVRFKLYSEVLTKPFC